jgi:hypothetical protein
MVLALQAGLPASGAQVRGSADLITEPAAAEAELRAVTADTFRSFGDIRRALGMPEEADKDAQNSNCVMTRRCSLEASLDLLRASADVLRDEIRGLQADDDRLAGPFGKAATDAVLPAAQMLARWKRITASLQPSPGNASAASRASPLQSPAAKLPATRLAVATAVRAAVDYLGFSGFATEPLVSLLADESKAR